MLSPSYNTVETLKRPPIGRRKIHSWRSLEIDYALRIIGRVKCTLSQIILDLIPQIGNKLNAGYPFRVVLGLLSENQRKFRSRIKRPRIVCIWRDRRLTSRCPQEPQSAHQVSPAVHGGRSSGCDFAWMFSAGVRDGDLDNQVTSVVIR
jgi:hypothetical protein